MKHKQKSASPCDLERQRFRDRLHRQAKPISHNHTDKLCTFASIAISKFNRPLHLSSTRSVRTLITQCTHNNFRPKSAQPVHNQPFTSKNTNFTFFSRTHCSVLFRLTHFVYFVSFVVPKSDSRSPICSRRRYFATSLHRSFPPTNS